MAVNLDPPNADRLLSIAGVRLGIAKAHVRKPNRKDLLMIELAEGGRVGGVFTRNRFAAAPVVVCREHLKQGLPIRAIVVNTGVANAGTGELGIAAAKATCYAAAQLLGARSEQVLPLSTGVIMERLPLDRIEAGLPACIADLLRQQLAFRGRGDHDHRHGAEGGLPASGHRRAHHHGDRHRQGRRDDHAEHGDDARHHRDRRRDRAPMPCSTWRATSPTALQRDHRGWRHLDQRHAAGARFRGARATRRSWARAPRSSAASRSP
jgi:hypothetical protein